MIVLITLRPWNERTMSGDGSWTYPLMLLRQRVDPLEQLPDVLRLDEEFDDLCVLKMRRPESVTYFKIFQIVNLEIGLRLVEDGPEFVAVRGRSVQGAEVPVFSPAIGIGPLMQRRVSLQLPGRVHRASFASERGLS